MTNKAKQFLKSEEGRGKILRNPFENYVTFPLFSLHLVFISGLSEFWIEFRFWVLQISVSLEKQLDGFIDLDENFTSLGFFDSGNSKNYCFSTQISKYLNNCLLQIILHSLTMVKAVVGEDTRLTSAEDRLSQSAIPAEVFTNPFDVKNASENCCGHVLILKL